MLFEIKTIGNWRALADGDAQGFADAQWQALRDEGDKLKNVARQSVRKAKIRGAARMATSWRGKIFPEKPGSRARAPAYVLGTNAAMPLDHLESGITITAKGSALVIPIGPAARFKQPNFVKQSGRLERVMRAMEQQHGKLVLHKLRDGTMALGVWKPGAKRQRFLALFILKKTITIPKKLDTRAEIVRAAEGWEQRVGAETMRLYLAGREQRLQRAQARLM